MKMLSPTTALLLAGAGAVAFVSTGAASSSAGAAAPSSVLLQTVAQTDASPTAPATSGTSTAHKRGALSGRGLHADFVAKGKAGTFITAAFQRGEVTAVSPTSITLKSDDGFVRTYVILPATKISQNHAIVDASALKTGEKAALLAVKDADAYDVRHISLPRS